jgi:hypothetical protein
MNEASLSAAVSTGAVSIAERTKGRQSYRALADLNKHGVPPLFLFFAIAHLCAQNSIRALTVFHVQSSICLILRQPLFNLPTVFHGPCCSA